jgi:hypothetical protein
MGRVEAAALTKDGLDSWKSSVAMLVGNAVTSRRDP